MSIPIRHGFSPNFASQPSCTSVLVISSISWALFVVALDCLVWIATINLFTKHIAFPTSFMSPVVGSPAPNSRTTRENMAQTRAAAESIIWTETEVEYLKALLAWDPTRGEPKKRSRPREKKPVKTEFRVLVVGGKGVGKTSIMQRVCIEVRSLMSSESFDLVILKYTTLFVAEIESIFPVLENVLTLSYLASSSAKTPSHQYKTHPMSVEVATSSKSTRRPTVLTRWKWLPSIYHRTPSSPRRLPSRKPQC